MISTTIICGLACVALVAAEWRHHETARYVAKVFASCAFVATGILAFGESRTTTPEFQYWILIGLVLGVAGDVALLSKRGFLIGLGAFLAGHLAYAIAIGYLVPPRAWLGEARWLAIAPVAIGLGVLATLWRKLDKLAVPVCAYVAVIITMVIAAIAAWRTNTAPSLLPLGAVLFFASDIAVASDRFVAPTFTNKAWGLPAYYAAQLLIAWSVR